MTDELKGLSYQQDMHKYINDTRRTHNIKFMIATGKSSIQQEGSCHQQPEHKFNEETNKCYIWRIALYGAATWTLQKVDQKYLKSVQMWCWRRMETTCTNCVTNEEVLHTGKDRNIL